MWIWEPAHTCYDQSERKNDDKILKNPKFPYLTLLNDHRYNIFNTFFFIFFSSDFISFHVILMSQITNIATKLTKSLLVCSSGILIYEMLVGYPPFYDDNPFGIYEKILSCKVDWPRQMDAVAKDLLKKLLVPDRTKRLGNMKNGGEDIRRHRWFKHLDWDDVLNRKLTVSWAHVFHHKES